MNSFSTNKKLSIWLFIIPIVVIFIIGIIIKEKITEKQFLFIRHGETNWSISRLKESPIDDPLNSIGKQQIKNLYSKLIDIIPKNKHLTIIASPLARTSETASIISKYLNNTPIKYDFNLRERHYGTFSSSKIESNIPLDIESKEDFATRSNMALQDIINISQYNNFLIIVAHGGIFKEFLKALNLKVKHIEKGQMALFTYNDKWKIDIIN